MPHSTVRFYCKPDCPLCDAGLLIVQKVARRFECELEKIDIAEDPERYAKYLEKIPVVEVDGRVLDHGKLSERRLGASFREEFGRRGFLRRFRERR